MTVRETTSGVIAGRGLDATEIRVVRNVTGAQSPKLREERCKGNGVDPQAWLADVLARIAGYSTQRLDALLPWHWKAAQTAPFAEAA